MISKFDMKMSGVLAIYWPDDAGSVDDLRKADELWKKEARSRSWVFQKAIHEYVLAHYPGNSQTDFRSFTGEMPLPKALRDDGDTPTRKRKVNDIDVQYFMTKGKTKDQAVEHLKRQGYVEE